MCLHHNTATLEAPTPTVTCTSDSLTCAPESVATSALFELLSADGDRSTGFGHQENLRSLSS